MHKTYIVRLNDAEREQLNQIVKKFSGSSQKVCRAQILLKSDANGLSWTHKQIADAFGCRITRQCVNGRRISSIEFLATEIAAWSSDSNAKQRGVDWQMRIAEARYKLKSVYPKIRV